MRRFVISAGLSLALVMPLATVATAGQGHAYGKRIKACTGLSYGQLRKALRAGGLEGHDPALVDGLRPAWGAKRTWLHIEPFCVPSGGEDEGDGDT